MKYTTEWTLYRHGEEIKLDIIYLYKESPTGLDSKSSIRIVSTAPYTQLSYDEWDELVMHCLTDMHLNVGKALLAES